MPASQPKCRLHNGLRYGTGRGCGYGFVTLKSLGYAWVPEREWGLMARYRETVSWPFWCHLLFGAAILICLVSGAILVADRRLWSGAPGIVAGVVMLIVWLRMRTIVLEAGPEGIAFGFVRPRRRVSSEQVIEAVEREYSVARYMGWGYRFGWKPRDRAYSVIGCQRGVELRFRDPQGEWTVFVSCRSPDRVIGALGSREP